MSYVGKILVVVQVVMSLLFMAFAGAVFSMHQNWKEKYAAEETKVASANASLQEVRNELDIARTQNETQLAEEKARADRIQALNLTLEDQVQNLRLEVEKKEAQREEQTGLAIAKQEEAQYRQAEAAKQRIENDKLRVALDDEAAKVRDMQDQIFTRDVTLEELRTRYKDMLREKAYLERIVASNNFETDPSVAEKRQLPPPPVDGLVVNVSKNRANNVEFVELSIGSDDGLVVSHQLDVIRLDDQKRSSDWLGRIRVVSVEPDSSVARVILPAKNGIIQTGDVATSNLAQRTVSQTN